MSRLLLIAIVIVLLIGVYLVWERLPLPSGDLSCTQIQNPQSAVVRLEIVEQQAYPYIDDLASAGNKYFSCNAKLGLYAANTKSREQAFSIYIPGDIPGKRGFELKEPLDKKEIDIDELVFERYGRIWSISQTDSGYQLVGELIKQPPEQPPEQPLVVKSPGPDVPPTPILPAPAPPIVTAERDPCEDWQIIDYQPSFSLQKTDMRDIGNRAEDIKKLIRTRIRRLQDVGGLELENFARNQVQQQSRLAPEKEIYCYHRYLLDLSKKERNRRTLDHEELNQQLLDALGEYSKLRDELLKSIQAVHQLTNRIEQDNELIEALQWQMDLYSKANKWELENDSNNGVFPIDFPNQQVLNKTVDTQQSSDVLLNNLTAKIEERKKQFEQNQMTLDSHKKEFGELLARVRRAMDNVIQAEEGFITRFRDSYEIRIIAYNNLPMKSGVSRELEFADVASDMFYNTIDQQAVSFLSEIIKEPAARKEYIKINFYFQESNDNIYIIASAQLNIYDPSLIYGDIAANLKSEIERDERAFQHASLLHLTPGSGPGQSAELETVAMVPDSVSESPDETETVAVAPDSVSESPTESETVAMVPDSVSESPDETETVAMVPEPLPAVQTTLEGDEWSFDFFNDQPGTAAWDEYGKIASGDTGPEDIAAQYDNGIWRLPSRDEVRQYIKDANENDRLRLKNKRIYTSGDPNYEKFECITIPALGEPKDCYVERTDQAYLLLRRR